MSKLHVKSGFTIVELLIVIVVIAILAAISIVTYQGIQTRAQNSTAYQEFSQYVKVFEAYRATNGTWPSAMAVDQEYCLGSGFPHGRCEDHRNTADPTLESASNELNEQLSTVAQPPSAEKYPVDYMVGPYARVCGDWWRCETGELLITGIFRGAPGSCPAGTQEQWSDGTILWCDKRL